MTIILYFIVFNLRLFILIYDMKSFILEIYDDWQLAFPSIQRNRIVPEIKEIEMDGFLGVNNAGKTPIVNKSVFHPGHIRSRNEIKEMFLNKK